MSEPRRIAASGRVVALTRATRPAEAARAGWPQRARTMLGRHVLALTIVAVPCGVALAYLGLVAADRYASEAAFVVRSPGRPQLPGLGASAPGAALAVRTGDDAHAVIHFMRSRDALDLLVREHDFEAMLARPEADLVSRFPRPFGRTDFEALFERFRTAVTVHYDQATGISMLEVQLFRPEDAAAVARALLTASEGLVNRLNMRARQDIVAAAETDVVLARAKAGEARDRLTRFRAREGLLDPTRTALAVEQNIGKLAYEVAQANAQLSETRRVSPQSPQIGALLGRIRSLQAEIDQERARIGGQDVPLAPRLAEYERLVLETGFADKAQETALAALEAARTEAVRQQLYLERVVDPRVPDYPAYPKRLLWSVLVVVTSLATFAILRAFIGNLRAHEPR